MKCTNCRATMTAEDMDNMRHDAHENGVYAPWDEPDEESALCCGCFDAMTACANWCEATENDFPPI